MQHKLVINLGSWLEQLNLNTDTSFFISSYRKGYAFLFLLLSTTTFSQIQTELNPEAILIGDTAALHITITIDSESQLQLPKLGDSLSSYIEISNIKTDSLRRGRNLNIIQNITLTGFEEGDFLIKGLPIKIDGKTYLTDSFQLSINGLDVDESKQGLFPIKPIMSQDITWWEKNKQYIYYIIAGVILLIVIFIIIWLYIRESKRKKYISTPLLPPYEEALNNLKKLDKENYLNEQKYYEFYSELSIILRRYFDRRFNFPTMALLSSDMANLMNEKEFLTDSETIELKQFLQDADFTKYGRKIPAPEKHAFYRSWVEEIIHKTRPIIETSLPEHVPTEVEKENIRNLDRN